MDKWKEEAKRLCPDIPVAENRCEYPTVINMQKTRDAIAAALRAEHENGKKIK